MKKRVFTLLLCAVLVFSLFGCTGEKVNNENETSPTQTSTAPVEIEGYNRIDETLITFESPLFNKAELTKGYEALDTDEQRAAYKLIDENVLYISKEKIDGDYKINPVDMRGITLREAELHLVIFAYSMDHPEVFWLESKFAYYTTQNQTFLQLNSGLSAEEIILDAKKMQKAVDSIFADVTADMSEYDRELEIHNAFLRRCEYADHHSESTDDFRVYTSVGALVDNYAVCEGYSRAMQVLLSAAGIEAYHVLGIGNEELHMWNTVKIDSDWYFLDSTWNDTDTGDTEYDYFNITTEQVQSDHTISPLYWDLSEEEVCGNGEEIAANFNIFVPECEKKDRNFYQQKSVTVQGFDDATLRKIADALVDAVTSSRTAVYLYLDPLYLDYYDAVNNLFYSGDYAIFTCISLANEELLTTQIKEEYVTTSESPEFCVVTIYIEY